MQTRTLTLLTCAVAFTTFSTAQTPALVKDINPTGNSGPGGFACFGNATYFSATDGVNGTELWKTDGTETGTVMVKDINPGSGSSFPRTFMPMNGLLYFLANGAGTEVVIWRTDGTEAGTQLVLTLADVPGLLEWITFAAFPESGPGQSDRIFFRGYDTDHGRELWSTDGTAGGTQLFLDINPGAANSGVQDPVAYNGKLYFTANDGTNGSEPWISDGTLAGTQMIAETVPGPGSSGTSPSLYTGAGNLVFFKAGTGATGDELWVTDGTVSGTGLVRDIYLGTNGSSIGHMAEHNGLLYFRANNFQGNAIWQSDGTLAGTVMLPMPATTYTSAEYLRSHGGWLYFTASSAGSRQLWRTDGTAMGTQEILLAGSDVTSPLNNGAPMLSCNGELYFRASYITATGQELYTLALSTGHEERAEDLVRLYPNPATDRMMVHLPQATDTRLMDNSGRVVRSWRLAAGSNTVDLSGLADGPYIMVTEASAHRIVKQ